MTSETKQAIDDTFGVLDIDLAMRVVCNNQTADCYGSQTPHDVSPMDFTVVCHGCGHRRELNRMDVGSLGVTFQQLADLFFGLANSMKVENI